MLKLVKSASSPFVTSHLRGDPTLIGEAVNGFLTGKSLVLTTTFYFIGKVIMSTCGRQLILAKEKLMLDENERIRRLEREIRRKEKECSQYATKTALSQRTEF